MVRISSSDVRRRRPRWNRVFAAVAVAPAVAGVAFVGAIAGSDRLRSAVMERSGAVDLTGAVRAVIMAPANRILAATSLEPGDRISLNVKFKHIHEIHEQRDEALRTGNLTTSDADLVRGSMEFADHAVRVRVRLAGDRVDRLEGDRWPLYVHTRGDDHVFGMRSFELRPPPAGGFHFSHLLLDHLAHEDVVAPQYGLIDFTLNGKPIGLMTFEEVPAAELLARFERREGPILRFDSIPRFGEAVGVTAIAPLHPERVADSRSMSRYAATAARLLEEYLHESLRAADVFDTELFGRFFAIVDRWGAEQTLYWRNLRFYFNPLTTHLEPVAVVGDSLEDPSPEPRSLDPTGFRQRMIADPDVAAAYEEASRRIDAAIAGEELARRFRADDANWLRLLHREFPLRTAFDAESHLVARGEAPRAQSRPGVSDRSQPALAGSAASDIPLPDPTLAETLANHPFLGWDAAARELLVAEGNWEVVGSLLLPEGVGLFVPAGTTLRFQARHGLIARGPLRFEGREDAPIVLEGPAARRRSELWAGIYVMESKRPSHWSHVVVRNTGGFKQPGFALAGGVVFRKAPLTLAHCSFRGDRTDDALNLVRTKFTFTDVEIVDAELDAFDADYSEGEILGGRISRAGGDGVDLGGSHATIRGTHISNVRDKAVSVGEVSSLLASGLTIDHVGIGIASKNGSTAEISDSDLSDVSDVALVVYMNQPEFGPGALVATNNRITRTALPALAQTGSRLELDGRSVRPVDAAINKLYKDVIDATP